MLRGCAIDRLSGLAPTDPYGMPGSGACVPWGHLDRHPASAPTPTAAGAARRSRRPAFLKLASGKASQMENPSVAHAVNKYPLTMRLLHWARAILIGAQLWTGWTMVRLDDNLPAKFDWYYPTHKEFGVLTLLLVLTQLAIRSGRPLPPLPASLPSLDRRLARLANYLLYALAIIVPLMGYSMSSTFTQSDGVPFFFFRLPELLPKNDHWFVVFQWLHRTLAYTLLALIVLHIMGALKHRFFDPNRENDVLRRML